MKILSSMFRKFFCLPVFLVLILCGQAARGGSRDSTEQLRRQKILIIPYEPRMHLSDADLDISEYSERTPQEIRAMFRMGLAEKLNAKLGANYQTHSLMQDLRPEARQELDRIYRSIDYSFDTSLAILHPKPDSTQSKGKWNENKARKKALAERTSSGDVKYMNVKILDPDLLPALYGKYGADVIVFLTQVEIKTNAKDCIDFQSQNYQREFKVHYSVFGNDGRQIFGDVAIVKFPSASNEIGDIMAKNFPALGDAIIAGVNRP
jgi:hypothetical protein